MGGVRDHGRALRLVDRRGGIGERPVNEEKGGHVKAWCQGLVAVVREKVKNETVLGETVDLNRE